MKMSETKPGDFIKFKNNEDEIGFILINPAHEDEAKIVILWTASGDGIGDYYSLNQYRTVFKDYDVIPLKLGVKDVT